MSFVSGRVYAGQTTGLGTAPQALGSGTLPSIREVLVQSDPGNTTNLLIGNVTEQHVVLQPGQAITVPVCSLTLVYIKMVSLTGTVNWLARD